MNWLQKLWQAIEHFFASPKGQQTISTINTLVNLAVPIVQEIAAVTGNAGAAASVTAVVAAYQKFGVPLETSLETANSTQVGNALQNLAVTLLQKALPANLAGVATNVLTTAVSLAYTAFKSAT